MRFSSAFIVCFYFLLLLFFCCCSSSVSAACKITTRTTAAGDRQQYRNSNFENERTALALVHSRSLALSPSAWAVLVCARSLSPLLSQHVHAPRQHVAHCWQHVAHCSWRSSSNKRRSETNEISKQIWKYIVGIYFAPSTRLFLRSVYASLSPSATLPLLFCLSTFAPRLFIFNAISCSATRGACWQASGREGWHIRFNFQQCFEQKKKFLINCLTFGRGGGLNRLPQLSQSRDPMREIFPLCPLLTPPQGFAACPELIRRVKWNVCCCHM